MVNRADRDPTRSLTFPDAETPPERGFLDEAADGIRTHDLLHGKQTL
jgi:hypothetical protein